MKILIADDEERIVDILRKFLESKGLRVDYALDGKKVLDLIKEQDYDIVFLDINMPELTGFEILRYVKDNKMRVKVVFLTGYPCVDEKFCKTLRVDEYLEKPVDLKVIEEIVVKYKLEGGKK